MTVFHDRAMSNLKTLGIITLFVCMPLNLVIAQSGPVRLAPPQKITQEKQEDIPPSEKSQQVPVGSVVDGVDKSIQVDALQTINPDTAGVLDAKDGGFGIGMWKGTSQQLLSKMIMRLPVNIKSKAMRDLMRRLLMSTAILPEGMAGDGSYIASRISLLSNMGDISSVNQLLDATPGRSKIRQLVRYEAEARFLANDNARACSLAAQQISTESSPFWQKSFIFCQALAGEHDKAALGVTLLQEVGDDDEPFYSLVDALAGNPATIESLPDPTPMHLSIARVAKAQLPSDVVASSRPGILRTIAVSPNASVEIRLEAAERAEIAGALDVDTLRQLYTSVSFSDQELANPLSKAEAESGPLSRALLYRTSLIQTVPTAQAEAASKALYLGREGGRYASIARVFLPVLKRIPPSAELSWFAPEIIRAFLSCGEQVSATPWFSLLRTSAQHNQESAEALVALLPVARLAGYSHTIEWSSKHLNKWWEQVRKDNGASNKAALLYNLLEVLGDDVPRKAWDALLDGPQLITIAMPNSALWHSLDEATKVSSLAQKVLLRAPFSDVLQTSSTVQTDQDVVQTSITDDRLALPPRIGEIILLALIALGESGPSQSEPIVLRKVLDSLKTVGLESEVRALALEAAVAAGL
ncbi:MAG: hypothetical protein CMF71_08160 [Magnetovibrio sp.]|nr:hypothetical protein [Magnetovibrio sp.]